MAKDEGKKETVIQHPANATHMALPTETMQKLITAAAQKYTWAELDPLMTEVKGVMVAVRREGDSLTLVQPPPE